MTWKPLFNTYQVRSDAVKRIRFIANELTHFDDNSLMSGKAGGAIFFYYAYDLLKDPEYRINGQQLISECVQSIPEEEINSKFSTGFTGIVWALINLSQSGFLNIDQNAILREIDKIAIQESKEYIDANNFDYLAGGLGCGLYFLQRLPNSQAREMLECIVDKLDFIAEKNKSNITWLSEFQISSLEFKSFKHYNLGLSHGIPSIIFFLSLVFKCNIRKERCASLIDGCIKWLLSQQLEISRTSMFPNFVGEGIPIKESRLGWCYGDLGIANALWHAGCVLENLTWKQSAISILLHSCNRKSLKETALYDASFCHGTIGAAHIFNRFFQYTQINEFKETSGYWFEKSLQFAKFPDGIGGYKMWDESQDTQKWFNSVGLLIGSAGVGLSLISAISYTEPKWDHCLLLSTI